MAGPGPAAPAGAYPERADATEGPLDRFVTQVGWRLHGLLRRRLGDPSEFATVVEGHASGARAGSLAQRLPELRYRLRRAGFTPDLLAECFGLYCVALQRGGGAQPAPEVLAAARELVAGGIVEVADPAGRLQALALAAAARGIHGTPVHLLATSDFRAGRIAAELLASFEALGIGFGCVAPGMAPRARAAAYREPVVCATHRDVAIAYLQDRLRIGGRPRLLLRALDDDARQGGDSSGLILSGLNCALVEEADLVMLDDAYAPVTITVEADQSQERLLYEQALEFARACEPDADFVFDEHGMRLTEPGAARLERLVSPLGGVWGAKQRREELVATALAALHAYERGVDYAIERGRVVFPKPDPGSGDAEEPDAVLRKLVELKEGCRLDGARDVIARISVPRFFRRYLHLAGVCADARGIEGDFWALYGLKATGAGAPAVHADCQARVFTSVDAKRAAVVAVVRERTADAAVVVAVRTPREAQALLGALQQAGHAVGLVRGRLDEEELAALARLHHPGGVALTLFPAECNILRDPARGARLHLVVAELHDAARHVTHIARAYAAQSCDMLVSLDEEGITSATGKFASAAAGAGGESGELSPQRSRRIARAAQRQLERARELTRRDLILRDEYMDSLLAFSGGRD
jgi:preprotein translocase subunit SecA